MFEWTKKLEAEALRLKTEDKMTYVAIAKKLGTTPNSVKHKIRRLQQAKGMEKYSHPKEKAEFAEPALKELLSSKGKPLRILETHCGFGGMSKVYSEYGCVYGYDIVQSRIDEACSRAEGFTGFKADSEKEILRLKYEGEKFDVVDVDPYGLPSRYFPHAFGLINDGYMMLTFPMMGVAQINALTIKHYQVYWGIELEDKLAYLEKISAKLHDLAYMEKRKIEIVKVERIDRVYRFLIKVQKAPLTEIIGMKINR
ncbi:class I SAM-dependent methyltransferase [Vibrio parahaemolyticus]|uniref:Class I SAM-dependent methyltransferase n=1 Tax=Vibrio parahaemolyticus TaxID=670 RepID=A0AAW8Q6C1_VIBPH|nr:class I SAM-dependent methyltransferase [Vibrio parahaemolyticus]MDS1823824.1 class I SAM-dependent methyltransferase [Vibrio parahaemolyticus]